jgi:AraC-like DNA-binding protein
VVVDDIRLSLSDDGQAAARGIDESSRSGCTARVLPAHQPAVDSRIVLRAVSFPFAAPAYAAVYALLFPAPLKQIALALGSRSEKSLSRAFRHCSGTSPVAWRRMAETAPPRAASGKMAARHSKAVIDEPA